MEEPDGEGALRKHYKIFKLLYGARDEVVPGLCLQIPEVNHPVRAALFILIPLSHALNAVDSRLPSVDGGQKPHVSFRLPLSDCSAVYCPIKSTRSPFSLSSNPPFYICFHLPRGRDLLLSPGERVSSTSLTANN